MPKRGQTQPYQLHYWGPDCREGRSAHYSPDDAIVHAEGLIPTREIRAPQSHMEVTEKASGHVFWHWHGPEAEPEVFHSPPQRFCADRACACSLPQGPRPTGRGRDD